jgi:hypothetical protein
VTGFYVGVQLVGAHGTMQSCGAKTGTGFRLIVEGSRQRRQTLILQVVVHTESGSGGIFRARQAHLIDGWRVAQTHVGFTRRWSSGTATAAALTHSRKSHSCNGCVDFLAGIRGR